MTNPPVFVAESPETRKALEHARTLAKSDVSVLILGPDGSGRKRLAECIHDFSSHREGPFQALDCEFLEGTGWLGRLVGHVGGTPDAPARKKGLFESAAGGTLLLREIDRAPRDLQGYLQHVLQERTYTLVGGEHQIPLACRVLATAVRDETGLLPGLRGLLGIRIIRLLPLSQRPLDIPALVEHFRTHYNASSGKRLAPPAANEIAVLCRLPWNRNVKELETAIRTAVVESTGEAFSIDLLPDGVREAIGATTQIVSTPEQDAPSAMQPPDPIPDLTAALTNLIYQSLSQKQPLPGIFLAGDTKCLRDPLILSYFEAAQRAVAMYFRHIAKAKVQKREMMRRMGFEQAPGSPLTAELTQLVEAVLDEMQRSPESWVDMPGEDAILQNANTQKRRQSRSREVTKEEVKRVLPAVEESFRTRYGRKPNVREELPDLLAQQLDGRRPSASLVCNARKDLGIQARQPPSKVPVKPKKSGTDKGLKDAAEQEYENELATQSDPMSQADARLDEDAYRRKLQAMVPAELENEANRLHVNPALTGNDLIDRLSIAQVHLESIQDEAQDLTEDDLRELAQRRGIALPEGRGKKRLIAELHRHVMKSVNDR